MGKQRNEPRIGKCGFDFEMIQKRICSTEKSILGFPLIPFLWEICAMQNLRQILNPDFPIENSLHFLSEVKSIILRSSENSVTIIML